MLNKLYRLKKKKGAVLFVVIAMMTLLVIMATAAYYTARSSYKTAINNYDFSQLYLSTVSVSDMMIAAITNDAVDGNSAGNKFSDLKATILDSKKFGVGKQITAKNSDFANMNELPIEAGVLDGVQVVIKHENQISKQDKTGREEDKDLKLDYFLITTTGYYRDNNVSVQDRIAHESGKAGPPNLFDTFFTGTGKTLDGDDFTRCVVIDTHDISDDAFFENEYTVFKDKSAGNKFHGGITTSGNLWLEQMGWDVGNVSGSDSYLNDYSKWGNPDDEDSKKVSGTQRNDWLIGGSLIISGNSAGIDIGDNNLIIKGDLILIRNSEIKVKAKNVYVKGNIISLTTDKLSFDANVYVNGTVFTNLDISTDTADGDKLKARNVMINANQYHKNVLKESGEKPDWGKTELNDLRDFEHIDKNCSGSMNMAAGKELIINKPSGIPTDYANKAKKDGEGKYVTWDIDKVYAPVGFQVAGTTNYEKYVDYTKSINQILETEVSRNEYSYYSASDSTMGNELTIDFTKLSSPPKGSSTYTGSFHVNDDSTIGTATVSIDNSGEGKGTINLPYVKDGYVLDLRMRGASVSHRALDIIIQTPDDNKAFMPIVLKANYYNGAGTPDPSSTGTDKDGDNAFCWNVRKDGVANDGSGGQHTRVIIEGKGDVFFELGNYNKAKVTDPDDSEYFAFDPDLGLYTAIYRTLHQSQVGTRDQVDAVSAGNDDVGPLNALLKTEGGVVTPIPINDGFDDYNNQVMIISNKSGSVAYDNCREKTTVFGYLYTPFGDYTNWNVSKSVPIFGGMIVSNYSTQQQKYVYVEPDPQLLKNLEKALPKTPDEEAIDTEIWYTRDPYWDAGSNFLG